MIKNDVKDLNRALYDEIIRCIQDESLQSFKFLNISDDIANTILIRWFKDTATKTHAVLTQVYSAYPIVCEMGVKPYKPCVNTISWDCKDNSFNPVSSGIYFIRINTGTESHTHKMLMMK
jgi:hypothetical protein